MEASERIFWMESTLLILIYLPLINSYLVSGVTTKENIACYGNFHNYVKLECTDPQVILNVTKVLLGAKPVVKDCPTTTNTDNYKEECCREEIGDCMIPTKSQVANRCLGHRACEIQTIWTLVGDVCQPNTYPRFTNFMSVRYQCGDQRDEPSITTNIVQTYPKTQTSLKKQTYLKTQIYPKTDAYPKTQTHPKSSTIKSTSRLEETVIKAESTTLLPRTHLGRTSSSLRTSPSSALLVNEPRSSMTGIIIGISCGFLGMLLSALGLWIYCSRKNQAASKPASQAVAPPSHFLENILSYSQKRKSVCKGYNNFSNLLPSTNPVLTRRDGQHVQILRSPSDASDHSSHSPGTNTVLNSATVSTSISSSQHPHLSSSSDRPHPQGITILNNFSCI